MADELALVAKNKGSSAELVKQLSVQDDQARAILQEGIQAWAKQQGLSVAKTSSVHLVALTPTVTITTTPAGAAVYYLDAVDYSVCKAAGVLDQMDQWNQVPGQKIDMGGEFYFRADWPGGKTKQTAKILIEKNQTISLQAD